jgi:hypothetical protein
MTNARLEAVPQVTPLHMMPRNTRCLRADPIASAQNVPSSEPQIS